MLNSSKAICALAVVALVFELVKLSSSPASTPKVPETSVAYAAEVEEQAPDIPAPQELVSQLTRGNDYPVEVIIPSINLDTKVIDLGVNSKGEMDVPDGKTNNVGWYRDGTIPGNVGSAVLDAHVFAAFKNLRHVKVGDDVYVRTKSGKYLHFRIESSLVYPTAKVPVQTLFNRSDKPRLNLITCAGKFIKSMGTYDHRLVDYAVLVDE